ncbi:dihydrolipoyl dehydrogenase family protein [Streptomyces iconiensis]|uniref:NAD(P)/FAD-dependent oxidoreductase n=1 Tax=Streptomyces iconiensis TaxID=1384038 RepID=A0ABT6ZSD1_9ACTN|nr:NAD(P)/FAD-dependent oxidoreductase [Streptomyces iconiensis]MDJ1131973.1 NAD(P)/FAD-dependent oxidoreductase [Streptomyces iconiensis]
MARECDVIVVGMGPGGEEVAGRLAQEGLDVVGVEAELLGGECPYWACVPSKMIVRAGNVLAEVGRSPGMAGPARAEPDFSLVAARIRDEATTDWDDASAVERFTGKGGTFVRARGRIVGPGQVEAGGETYSARRAVVVATGSGPMVPPVEGLEGTPYWTNREAISTPEAPGSLLVLGGGAVGVELAQGFSRFGTEVTVVEASERLVPPEEPESAALLERVLDAEGVTVRTGARASAVRHSGDTFTLTLENGEELSAQRLLVATGRRPRLKSLGLDTLGLDPEARALHVDAHMRAAPGVWAVGDVTGEGAFTHMAMYQADIAVRSVLGQEGPGADYSAVSRVTFTDPEIGAVGLTEQAARDKGLSVRTGQSEVPSSTRGWIHKAGNDGLVKLVEDADRGVLVGATSAGPMGGEVLYGLAVAVRAAVPVSLLRNMIYAYPTFHRGVLDALADLETAAEKPG